MVIWAIGELELRMVWFDEKKLKKLSAYQSELIVAPSALMVLVPTSLQVDSASRLKATIVCPPWKIC